MLQLPVSGRQQGSELICFTECTGQQDIRENAKFQNMPDSNTAIHTVFI